MPRVHFVPASDAGELKIGNEGNAEPPRKVLMSNARVLITNAGSAVEGQIRETTTKATESATKQRHKLCLHTQIFKIKKSTQENKKYSKHTHLAETATIQTLRCQTVKNRTLFTFANHRLHLATPHECKHLTTLCYLYIPANYL